ncbi:MAG: hypothetical protein DHS80DRAFT_30813 [Piptocephalis tieghemiana]|nr:MAG: hypothetical protein DHS80DRAFT_30813 [Piptocephalis tieghemiana]
MIAGSGFNSEHVLLLLRHTLGSWVFTSVIYASLRLGGWYTSPLYQSLMVYTALLAAYSTWKRYQEKRIESLDYSEEVVLITGGSGGVGWSLAQVLAFRGADVITLDNKEPPSRYERNITSYLCDLTDPAQIDKVTRQIIEKHGHVSILVNNAALVKPNLLTQANKDNILQEFKVNTIAPILMIQAFLPGMLRANHGHILTVGSILGSTGLAYGAGYCSSKAALIRVHESLLQELVHVHKTSKVHASCIIPGYINTPMFSDVVWNNPLTSFLLPKAETFEVAQDIVQVIDAQSSSTLYIPTMAWFSLFYPFLPLWMLNLLHWATSATTAFKLMIREKNEKVHTK